MAGYVLQLRREGLPFKGRKRLYVELPAQILAKFVQADEKVCKSKWTRCGGQESQPPLVGGKGFFTVVSFTEY